MTTRSSISVKAFLVRMAIPFSQIVTGVVFIEYLYIVILSQTAELLLSYTTKNTPNVQDFILENHVIHSSIPNCTQGILPWG